MDDFPGSLVGKQVGNYQANQLIGKGSMGEVYRGTHPILDKQVAIKVLSQDLSAYPELVSRFRREARAIARIKHPAIVEAFDFGNLPDGRSYYVMELLQGSNLATYMQAKGALPLGEAMDIAIPLLEGLSAAHEAGFIHRDIKPDNIFLVRTEEGKLFPKLIDFGIAKLRNPDEQGDSVVTRIDAVMGTPLYMSPEQAPGSTETVGAWSDIYSTAATLYHVICGKPPFYSDNPLELMLMHSWSPATPPREVKPEIPERISDVLMKALAKKPGERFPSMQAFTAALQEAISGSAGMPSVAPPTAKPPAAKPPAAAPPSATPPAAPAAADDDEEEAAFGDTVLEGQPLQEVEGVLLEDEEEPAAPASVPRDLGPTPAVKRPKTAETPVGSTLNEVKAPLDLAEPSDGASASPRSSSAEEAPRLEELTGGSVNTSLSGIASEKILEAPPPDATLYRRKRSILPWVLGGVGVAAGAVIAFFLLRGGGTTRAEPNRYTQLSARTRHTCAIRKTDGQVFCWGRNNYGQLGLGDTAAQPRPKAVEGLKDAQQISAGGRHTCALLAGGEVRCWGHNHLGQLGDGTTVDRHRPVPVKGLGKVTAISAGADHSCAQLEDGSLSCWGRNDRGQLGTGAAGPPQATPQVVRDQKAVLAVAAGGFHTCALAANGSVWCWGRNDVGQLGLGDTEGRTVATKVEGLSDVVAVSASGAHCCALKKGGEAWCWGDNASGQLGDGTTSATRKPTKVTGLPAARQISAGGGYLGGHTCAVTESSALYCWGANTDGQLGTASGAGRQATPQRISLGGKVSRVTAGGRHTCALLEDGALYCWGANADGQLGDASGAGQPSPRQIP